MSSSFERRPKSARCVETNGFGRLALRCARNVYDATDRRMPEALALAVWLGETASSFGLAEAAVPDDGALYRGKRRGVAVQNWRKIGAALEEVESHLPERQDSPIDRWLGAITETLDLDPLEAEILSLALHYRLEKRVERLFDCLSECRGDPQQFRRDSQLIALLLNAPVAEVDSRLAPGAQLQTSGLLTSSGALRGALEGAGASGMVFCCAGTFRRKRICMTSFSAPRPLNRCPGVRSRISVVRPILPPPFCARLSPTRKVASISCSMGHQAPAKHPSRQLSRRGSVRVYARSPKPMTAMANLLATTGFPACGWHRDWPYREIRFCCSTRPKTCSSAGASRLTNPYRVHAFLSTVCWSA